MLGMDLGSNTLRVALMNEKLDLLKEYEYIIGAAKNLSKSKKISKEAISLLKNALYDLKNQEIDMKNVNAVATAAFRKAINTKEIFDEIYSEFNIKFKTIDAKEEARLSVLGMKHGLSKLGLYANNLAYCDLGGASCEVSFKNFSKSFDFGIISFYERSLKYISKKYNDFNLNTKTRDKKFKLYGLIKDDRLRAMAILAFKESANAKSFLKKYKCKTVILNSGVPTAIVALKQGLEYSEYQSSLINGKELYAGDFLHFAIKLYNMSEEKAALLLGKKRKNYIVAGCFLLYALFEKQKLIVIDEGIREGLCIDFYNKHK
ncbi:Ppx/GppA family phosphatase [uncultured Campylobacter sp.]|uniref:Ppx/GppA phosphatase family protein n=1 Tax=uncultured Campylobacter sp. TaxID=218934 RepID=UPI002636A08F|nr:Ppx/GppA family phosphatase [uncultured Campylobacter sp.]